jgi:transposase
VRAFGVSSGMSTDRAANDTPLTPEALPDDPVVLKQMIAELLESLQASRHNATQLQHRLDVLLRKMFGQRAERYDPNQPVLFQELAETLQGQHAPPEESPKVESPSEEIPKGRNGHGRRKLPKNLVRQRVEHQLSEAECSCPQCGLKRVKIAEDVSEQLDYHPASLFVIEHVRFVYACAKCEGEVATAPKPPQPIDKGLPGPGLLAQIVVSKYADHLPLHRLERIFSRHGLELSRSTMCDWVAAVAQMLMPLYDRLASRVLLSNVLQSDDTTIPVLDPKSGKTHTSRMWVYLGDRNHPYLVYDYTSSRARAGPEAFLGNYHGFMQADAYSGYDGIFAKGKIQEIGCWAHARRKFYDARDNDPARTHHLLGMIRQLYAVEKEAKEFDDEFRCTHRQTHARPLLDAMKTWLDEQAIQVLPKSPVGEAIRYALNQWSALTRYLENGAFAIDNNAAEHALRAVVLGRKNWLFAGSDKGGETAAILYTFMATCRQLGVEPFAYLRDVLTRLPSQPAERLPELLPDAWLQALTASSPST